MKTVSIIGTIGVPACYGGFETLVDNLLDYAPIDIKYTVICSKKKYKKYLRDYKNARLLYVNLPANGFWSILYDTISLWKSRKSDIILALGPSCSLFFIFFRLFYKGKIISNMAGIEWKRDKWNFFTQRVIKLCESCTVRFSDIIIGDNKGIIDYIKSEYKVDAELIAYGGDQVEPVNDDFLYTSFPFCKSKYAIAVCRIQPDNHIHTILDAFASNNFMNLVFVGNWNSCKYGIDLKNKYICNDNLFLLDPIYNSHVINWLRTNATLYVHGHSAGGTNPSLVEAMNLQLPILAFDCIFNRATTENSCLYWSSSKDLLSLINSTNNEQLNVISESMLKIAKEKYTWKVIANQYNNLYNIN